MAALRGIIIALLLAYTHITIAKYGAGYRNNNRIPGYSFPSFIPETHPNNSPGHPSYQTNELPEDDEQRVSKDKVLTLGSVLKQYVHKLRQTSNRQVDLVFLVDSSASVGEDNFKSELKFVRKLLADFTVDQNTTRVAVITFSSKSRVVREVDQISESSGHHHKCSMLEDELPAIRYTGGGTYTLGAMQEAQVIPSAGLLTGMFYLYVAAAFPTKCKEKNKTKTNKQKNM
jgi:hypothetical protein